MPFFEDYTLLDELGQGGYAKVYKVRHNKLGYIRALRVLNDTIALGEQDKTYQKFLKECSLLLRLGNGNHPNIVHIYQPLLKAQQAIVEMDFVDGKDLFHYIKDSNHFVETKDVLKLLDDIGSALAYCHEDIYKSCMDRDEDGLKDDPNDGSKVLLDDKTKQRLIEKYRVIHNDIHSGNIIRRENGSYVLLDFGLAINGDEVVRSSRRENGAPEFKAPEKWDKDVLTTQSDIYSFGVVLYEFLAGRVPFPLSNKHVPKELLDVMKAHLEQKPEPIFDLRKAAFEASHPGQEYEKDYPDWLEQVIMKCLEKSPNDRFKNGKELHDFVLEHIDDDNKAQTLAKEKESSELHKHISNLEHRLVVLQEKLDSTASDSKAQEVIKHLRKELEKQWGTNKELKTEIDLLKQKNKKQEQRLNACVNDEELSRKIGRVNRELQITTEKLKAANNSNVALQMEIAKLKSMRTIIVIIALLLGSVIAWCATWSYYEFFISKTKDKEIALLESKLDKTTKWIESLKYLDNNNIWDRREMEKLDPSLVTLWDHLNKGEFEEILAMPEHNDILRYSKNFTRFSQAISIYSAMKGRQKFVKNSYCGHGDTRITIDNYINKVKKKEVVATPVAAEPSEDINKTDQAVLNIDTINAEAKADATATPAKPKATTTPAKPKATTTPAKPKATTTPVKVKDTTTPVKAKATATPAELNASTDIF